MGWHPVTEPSGAPPGRAIDVWAIDLLDPPVDRDDLAALLTSEERRRAGRFRFPEHQRRFAVRRGAMRWLLGRYLERDPESLRLIEGANGKPDLEDAVVGGDRLVFNLTDSADLALLAVGVGEELGVDVESLERPRETARLVQRFFSEQEREVFAALPPELEVSGFFRAWTCKEAYLKAIGTGLRVPLRHCTVELDPRKPARAISVGGSEDEATAWALLELDPPAPGFVGALAIRRSRNVVRTFRWVAGARAPSRGT